MTQDTPMNGLIVDDHSFMRASQAEGSFTDLALTSAR